MVGRGLSIDYVLVVLSALLYGLKTENLNEQRA
jgi:hypothetical protein